MQWKLTNQEADPKTWGAQRVRALHLQSRLPRASNGRSTEATSGLWIEYMYPAE